MAIQRFFTPPKNEFLFTSLDNYQPWYMECANLLNIYPNKEGTCSGLSFTGILAVLASDIETFNLRWRELAKLPKSKLVDTVNQLERKRYHLYKKAKSLVTSEFKPSEKNIPLYFAKQEWQQQIDARFQTLLAALPAEERVLLDLPIFFSMIDLGQKIRSATHLDKDISINKPWSLLLPKKLEEEGGVVQAANFSGCYSKAELISFFSSLHKVLQENTPHNCFPFSLLFNSLEHELTVSYDPATDCWVFINANFLPAFYFSNLDALATLILSSMQQKSHVVLTTKIYCSQKNEASLKRFLDAWFQSKDFLSMHMVTSIKASFANISSLSGVTCRGSSWLLAAATLGELNIVKSLLKETLDINERFTYAYKTPLIAACQHGKLSTANFLLQSGADPNIVDCMSVTALHLACQNNFLPIVETLIEHKVDVNQCSVKIADLPINELSALGFAANWGNSRIVAKLLEFKADPTLCTTLSKASFPKDPDCVSAFLNDDRIDPNAIYEDQSCLIYAIAQKNMTTLRMLVEDKRINLNLRMPSSGLTALVSAAYLGRIDAVKILLSKGADAKLPDYKGNTVLHYLCGTKDHSPHHPAIICDLLDAGMSPYEPNKEGETAYNLAIKNNYLDNIESFLAKGYSPPSSRPGLR